MTQIAIVVCDRCKREHRLYAPPIPDTNWRVIITRSIQIDNRVERQSQHFDLCPECAGIIFADLPPL